MDLKDLLIRPLQYSEFKSYLIQALLQWYEDEGYTPYMLVHVDDDTVCPKEFVNSDGAIVFCVSSEATHNLRIDCDEMTFQARFGESVQNIRIPMNRIAAVYPKENTDLVSYFPVESLKDFNAGKFCKDETDDIPTFTKL